ncbi:MAG TPA: TlpA disulfide reductase family protein [Pyrinomonadaceae bacterium]|jgi:thiol-disulfide isomerase/thioredoxin
MKLTRLLACATCAFALACVFELRQASGQVAAIERQGASLASGKSLMLSQRARKKQKRRRRAPLPVVHEIDAEGLKNILRRDTAQPRPLLINFWATWCNPCREEFPDLVRIDKDYKTRNLDFVIVSLDDPSEIKGEVPRFLRRMRAQMLAFLLNASEPNEAISAVDPEWAGGMPATFLLNAAGQVVYKHLGPIKPEELRAELEKVMK